MHKSQARLVLQVCGPVLGHGRRRIVELLGVVELDALVDEGPADRDGSLHLRHLVLDGLERSTSHDRMPHDRSGLNLAGFFFK